MVGLLWIATMALAAPPTPWARLARDLAAATTDRQALAAEQLRNAPAEDLPEIAKTVLRTVEWRRGRPFPFRGAVPFFAALRLNEPERQQLLTELMAHRVASMVRGSTAVAERVDAELHAILHVEIEAFGQPTSTTDWLHLFGAADGDVPQLLDRLGLAGGRWAYLVDEDRRLQAGELGETLSLLGHRSSVVRARAKARFEARPAEAARALRHAWRYTPGRAAPLRGDVAVPELTWDHPTALKFANQLVRWARRTQRQHDDRALRATLHLLTHPGLTQNLSEQRRQTTASLLLRLARKDADPMRSSDLGQAMDAVLRQVSFADGLRPAPEFFEKQRPTWDRMTPPG